VDVWRSSLDRPVFKTRVQQERRRCEKRKEERREIINRFRPNSSFAGLLNVRTQRGKKERKARSHSRVPIRLNPSVRHKWPATRREKEGKGRAAITVDAELFEVLSLPMPHIESTKEKKREGKGGNRITPYNFSVSPFSVGPSHACRKQTQPRKKKKEKGRKKSNGRLPYCHMPSLLSGALIGRGENKRKVAAITFYPGANRTGRGCAKGRGDLRNAFLANQPELILASSSPGKKEKRQEDRFPAKAI